MFHSKHLTGYGTLILKQNLSFINKNVLKIIDFYLKETSILVGLMPLSVLINILHIFV